MTLADLKAKMEAGKLAPAVNALPALLAVAEAAQGLSKAEQNIRAFGWAIQRGRDLHEAGSAVRAALKRLEEKDAG